MTYCEVHHDYCPRKLVHDNSIKLKTTHNKAFGCAKEHKINKENNSMDWPNLKATVLGKSSALHQKVLFSFLAVTCDTVQLNSILASNV